MNYRNRRLLDTAYRSLADERALTLWQRFLRWWA